MKTPSCRAFSLLELLVVMVIIVLLVALATPALNSVLESGRLTQAATLVGNQFTIGRQKAIAENRPISLRLIRKDESSSFDRLQLVALDAEANASAVARVVTLPVGTAISQAPTLSSLLNLPENAATASDPPIPALGKGYRYVQLSFRPRGSLDLSVANQWFATVVLSRDDKASTIAPPTNFASLQIDPVNGGVQLYRP